MVKNFFKHLHTINKHRFLVMKFCFRCGYYKRGLLHDLSKYSLAEFIPSVKFYQGNRSPTSKERAVHGYSKAWMHHKGRNKHHFEYWTDFNTNTQQYEPVEMPQEYLIEMFCDRIAASKVYLKKEYKDESPLLYFLNKDKTAVMHENTRNHLETLLVLLKTKGEKEVFHFIKKNHKKKDFLELISNWK